MDAGNPRIPQPPAERYSRSRSQSLRSGHSSLSSSLSASPVELSTTHRTSETNIHFRRKQGHPESGSQSHKGQHLQPLRESGSTFGPTKFINSITTSSLGSPRALRSGVDGSELLSPLSSIGSPSISPRSSQSLAKHGGAFVADLHLTRMSGWLARCVTQLSSVLAGERNVESLRLEPLSLYGKRNSVLIPASHAHAPTVEPIQPQFRRFSMSRVGSSLRGSPTSSSADNVTHSVPELSLASRNAGQTKAQALVATKVTLSPDFVDNLLDQCSSILQQLRDEIAFLGRNFQIQSEDAVQQYLQLCERILFDMRTILDSLKTGHPKNGENVESILDDVVYLIISRSQFDWSAWKKTLMMWIVKLIGSRGTSSCLTILMSCESVQEAISWKDAKFLISCVVSSIEQSRDCDPVAALIALLQSLPDAFQLKQETERLRPVWQEAVTYVLRCNHSETPRLRVLDVLAHTLPSAGSSASPLTQCGGSLKCLSANCDVVEQPLGGVIINFDTLESSDRQTIFSRACREGDDELVQRLVQLRVALRIKDLCRVQSDGTNALQQAVARRHPAVIETLFELLPPEMVLPAFEHKVKGKGTCRDIAAANGDKSIFHQLEQYYERWSKDIVAPLKEQQRQPPAVPPSVVTAEPFAGDLDCVVVEPESIADDSISLANIRVVDEPIPQQPLSDLCLDGDEMASGASRRVSEVETPGPLDTLRICAVMDRLPTTALQCINIVTDALESLFSQGNVALSLDSVTHDIATYVSRLLKHAQDMLSASKDVEGVDQANERLLTLIRKHMKSYLNIPSIATSRNKRSSSHVVPNVLLSHLPQTCNSDSLPSVQQLVHGLCSKAALLERLDPSVVCGHHHELSLNRIFGVSQEQGPIPTRVRRFLEAIRQGPLFATKNSSIIATVPIALIALVDDWFVAALLIDGMFPVIMEGCSTPLITHVSGDRSMPSVNEPCASCGVVPQGCDAASCNCLRDEIKTVLAERLMTAMMYLIGEMSEFGTMMLPDEDSKQLSSADAADTITALLEELKGDAVSLDSLRAALEKIRNRLGGIQCCYRVNTSTPLTAGSERKAKRTAAAAVATRSLALTFSAYLSLYDRTIFNYEGSIDVTQSVDELMNSYNRQSTSTGSSSDTQPSFDSVTSPIRGILKTPHDFEVERRIQNAVSREFALQTTILFVVASRVFVDVDDSPFLLGKYRMEVLKWFTSHKLFSDTLSKYSAATVAVTNPCVQLPMPHPPYWKILAQHILSDEEIQLFCSEMPNERNLSTPSFVLQLIFSRACACGDSALMNVVSSHLLSKHHTSDEASSSSSQLLTKISVGGFTPLMVAILACQRTSIDFMIALAKRSNCVSWLSQRSTVIGCVVDDDSQQQSTSPDVIAHTTRKVMLDALWISRSLADMQTTDLLSSVF